MIQFSDCKRVNVLTWTSVSAYSLFGDTLMWPCWLHFSVPSISYIKSRTCYQYAAAHLLILGSEVSWAVCDLCASVLNDLSADWDVGHSILPAVGVRRLEEWKDTGGWWRNRGKNQFIRSNIIHCSNHRASRTLTQHSSPCSLMMVMLTKRFPISAIPKGTSTASTSSCFLSSSSSLTKSGTWTSTDSTPSWNSMAPAASAEEEQIYGRQ